MPVTTSAIAPRIALIHSAQGAMDTVEQAFVAYWPEVERINLVDGTLEVRGHTAGEPNLTMPVLSRFKELTDYAVSMCAQGILYTCSQLGDAIEAARRRWTIPILKPHEAMFLSALEYGPRIGLVTSQAGEIESLTREFFGIAEEAGAQIELATLCVPEVELVICTEGPVALDQLLRERSDPVRHCDVVMLPDFIMARAATTLRRVIDRPVLAAPSAAVQLLKQLINAR